MDLEREESLKGELWTYYTTARRARQAQIERWKVNLRYLKNRPNANVSNEYLPDIRENEILPVISSRVGWMTDQEVEFESTPRALPNSPYFDFFLHQCYNLDALLKTAWELGSWADQFKLMFFDTAWSGTGIVKAVWDQSLFEGIGDAAVRRVSPWDFYPDPAATSSQDGSYYIEERRVTLEELERLYPQLSARDFEDMREYTITTMSDGSSATQPNLTNPGALPGGTGTYGLPGQGLGTETNYGIMVREFWLRQNEREELDDEALNDETVYDTWRVIVVAANKILLDEKAQDLYGINTHPYAFYRDEDIGDFWGLPLISQLAPLQKAINRLLSAQQYNAELSGNPIWMEAKGTGTGRTLMTSRPGQRLEIDNTQATASIKPGWVSPPQMPQQVMELIQFYISRIENISGLSGLQKGTPPPGRNSTQVMNQVQESGFVRVRSSLRNLEKTLRRSITLAATLIAENYTTSRTVAVIGPDGEKTSLYLASRSFYSPTGEKDEVMPLRFTIDVNAGSKMSTSRQAQIAEADTLFAMHAVDSEYVLRAHRVKNAKQITQRMQQQAQMMAFEAALAGGKKKRP